MESLKARPGLQTAVFCVLAQPNSHFQGSAASWLQAQMDLLPLPCIPSFTQQWADRLGLQGLHHIWVYSELYNCAWAH